MLTLYHGRTSVCSLKARLALAEKALNFDSASLRCAVINLSRNISSSIPTRWCPLSFMTTA
jgi:hypothetical protein